MDELCIKKHQGTRMAPGGHLLTYCRAAAIRASLRRQGLELKSLNQSEFKQKEQSLVRIPSEEVSSSDLDQNQHQAVSDKRSRCLASSLDGVGVVRLKCVNCVYGLIPPSKELDFRFVLCEVNQRESVLF